MDRSLAHDQPETAAAGDDYSARLLVSFGAELLGSDTRALCYVWAGRQPTGSVYPNPHSERVVTVVLRSGDARAGQWVEEARDVIADYRRFFGEEPAELAAVAFMVDTDDTGLQATGWLDDLTLDLAAGRRE